MACSEVTPSNVEKCITMELNGTFNFSLNDAIEILLEHTREDKNVDPVTEAVLIVVYGCLMAAGILANFIVIFVVARRPSMQTARNLYIANLTVSDLFLCLVCMPFTLIGILRRRWILGLVLCKLVPAVQGTNIMVSIGTITVIALDRYWTIVRGQDHARSRNRVITSIILVWVFSIIAVLPVICYQVVEEIKFNQLVLYETCIEKWSSQKLKVGYAACVLMVQAVIPALVVGLVHAQIAAYLNAHARTQRDSRRAQRELQRNRRTTLLLSGVAVLFAVSWLPLSVFSLLADLCLVSADSLYVTLAACHVMAMTSAVSNPVVYGWLNSNFRRELIQVLPRCCRRPAVESSQEPSPTLLLCQNGQKPQHNNPATTYTAL